MLGGNELREVFLIHGGNNDGVACLRQLPSLRGKYCIDV